MYINSITSSHQQVIKRNNPVGVQTIVFSYLYKKLNKPFKIPSDQGKNRELKHKRGKASVHRCSLNLPRNSTHTHKKTLGISFSNAHPKRILCLPKKVSRAKTRGLLILHPSLSLACVSVGSARCAHAINSEPRAPTRLIVMNLGADEW